MITSYKIFESKESMLYKFVIGEGFYDAELLFINTILNDSKKTCMGENFKKLGDNFMGDNNLFSTNSSFSSPSKNLKNFKIYNSIEFFNKFGLDICIKLYNTVLKKKEYSPAPHPNLDIIINELEKVSEIDTYIEANKYNL